MGALLRVLLLVGFVAKAWPLILAVVAIAVLAAVLWWFVRWLDRRLDARDARRATRAAELAGTAHRADVQNAQVASGDPRGIYGEYQPAQI